MYNVIIYEVLPTSASLQDVFKILKCQYFVLQAIAKGQYLRAAHMGVTKKFPAQNGSLYFNFAE